MHPEILKQNVIDTISIHEDVYLTTKDQDAIDTEIAKHEVLLHSLVQRIAALKNHRNSLSQTWRLPIEVLGNIMLTATQLSIKENNESDIYPTVLPLPLTLGHVCVSWRDLAWKLPELWSTIPLAIAKSCYEKQIVLLDAWLDRAGDLQDLSIILTLSRDTTELQYWKEYPPKEILEKLYKRSKQWHTFYSTLPNLCFDLLASVHQRLPRLNTLILNRLGSFTWRPTVQINNLGGGAGGPGPGLNVIQNGVFMPAHPGLQIVVNGTQFVPAGNFVPGANAPLAGIHLDTDTSRQKNPFYMLSEAPSLRTVVLPESLNPSDITLPWSNLTHLEVRTIPIDDCLRVLHKTERIVSFDFHGIYSSGLVFLPVPHLYLPELRKFSIFSDPSNIGRFLGSLTAPNLYSIEWKSTTGTLALVTNQLTQLVQRSASRLRKLGICVPSIGRSEEQIVECLMGEELRDSLEELKLESWQVDVEGLSNSFLIKMNPERRVRSVKTYSYTLDSSLSHPGVDDGGESPSGLNAMIVENTESGHETDIVAPGWVDVPTDEIREVVEQLVEVPDGEYVNHQEILLPNLVAMTYRGTLSFDPKVLRDTILARWKRKSRRRTVPRVVPVESPQQRVSPFEDESADDSTPCSASVGGWSREVVIMEEEDWFPTAELTAFEIYAPEMEFKEPIDEETNLVFREMLREGFYLSIETKKGILAF